MGTKAGFQGCDWKGVSMSLVLSSSMEHQNMCMSPYIYTFQVVYVILGSGVSDCSKFLALGTLFKAVRIWLVQLPSLSASRKSACTTLLRKALFVLNRPHMLIEEEHKTDAHGMSTACAGSGLPTIT
eukprot:1154460-Pelagomonas_calceolata.AAC.1